MEPQPKLGALDHIALTVSDLARSVAWYQSALGLQRVHAEVWGDVPVFMVGSDQSGVALFPASVTAPAPAPEVRRTLIARHFAFRVTGEEFQHAQTHLKTLGIAFTIQDHQIAHSLYLHDPDGHEIELTHYL